MDDIKYRIIKRDSEQRIYETHLRTDKELTEHLKGTFECTDHKVIAVINIKGE